MPPVIETGELWRARPACDLCQWVGAWHVSVTSKAAAEAAAATVLDGHTGFWHADRPLP